MMAGYRHVFLIFYMVIYHCSIAPIIDDSGTKFYNKNQLRRGVRSPEVGLKDIRLPRDSTDQHVNYTILVSILSSVTVNVIVFVFLWCYFGKTKSSDNVRARVCDGNCSEKESEGPETESGSKPIAETVEVTDLSSTYVTLAGESAVSCNGSEELRSIPSIREPKMKNAEDKAFSVSDEKVSEVWCASQLDSPTDDDSSDETEVPRGFITSSRNALPTETQDWLPRSILPFHQRRVQISSSNETIDTESGKSPQTFLSLYTDHFTLHDENIHISEEYSTISSDEISIPICTVNENDSLPSEITALDEQTNVSSARDNGLSSKITDIIVLAGETEHKPDRESSTCDAVKPEVLVAETPFPESDMFALKFRNDQPDNRESSMVLFEEAHYSIFKNRGALKNNLAAPLALPGIEHQLANNVPVSIPPAKNPDYAEQQPSDSTATSTHGRNDKGKELISYAINKQSYMCIGKSNFSDVTDSEARLSGFSKNIYDKEVGILALQCEDCGLKLNHQPKEDMTLLNLHAKRNPCCPFIRSKVSHIADNLPSMKYDGEVDDETSVAPDTLVVKCDPASNQTSSKAGLLPLSAVAGLEGCSRIADIAAQLIQSLRGTAQSKENLEDLGFRTSENDLQQMGREENRKKTFLTYPNHKALKLTGFIDNGWFWTGIDDILKCFRCDVECSDWHSSVDPLSRHIQLSPDCPFLLAKYTPEYREKITKENTDYTTPKPQEVIKNPPSRLIRPHAETRYATMIVNNYSKFYDPIDREIVSADEEMDIRMVGKKMIWRVMSYSVQYGIEIDCEHKILSILKTIRENKRAAQKSTSGAAAVVEGNRAEADPDYISYDEDIRQKLMKTLGPTSKHQVQKVNFVLNVEEVREQLRCTICLDALRSVLFTPCCHLAACAQCGFTEALCLVCRRKIQATIRVNVRPISTQALKNK